MFYLRAVEKDDKSTTPGLRKYYAGAGNKFSKLFDDNLLSNLKKILNSLFQKLDLISKELD